MVSYIALCGLNEVDSKSFEPGGSISNEVIIWTIVVSMLGGVEEKIPIRDESFSIPTPID